jgi:uncharacterized protein YraI
VSRRLLSGSLIAAVWLALGCATPASAEPATTTKYPASASATPYTGLAFDQCTAPSIAAMQAWTASPYRAVGVYIGGINRSCAQPRLTPDWVGAVTASGWSLMPIYVGLQPSCRPNPGTHVITAKGAATQGAAAATDAVTKAKALGMLPGTAIYNDIENYSTTDTSCRTAVLTYLSAWTTRLHALGFLSGVYVNLSSGAQHLAAQYSSTKLARPDALWVARYDGVASLLNWTGIPGSRWSQHQRAKQFLGNVSETYGGVRIKIDRNQWDAPVATVSFRHRITSGSALIARSGPSTSSRAVSKVAPGAAVKVACQTPGSAVRGTKVWNKLTNGTYVSDAFLDTASTTGYTKPISRCAYPYQVTSNLVARSGPGTSYATRGGLSSGSLAWVTCQRSGTAVGGTKVWNKLSDGHWVTDRYVATPSSTSYSAPIPRC